MLGEEVIKIAVPVPPQVRWLSASIFWESDRLQTMAHVYVDGAEVWGVVEVSKTEIEACGVLFAD